MTRKTATVLRDALEHEIVEGRLRPGEHLDEMSLAARFDVSRTPIREALLGLESSGLVEIRPRRGAFVRRVSARELVEMFETMAELEAACCRFACQRMTDAQEDVLMRRLQLCEEAAASGAVERYYAENELFHTAIYAASGNSFLEAQSRMLQSRLKPFRRHQLHARGRMKQSQTEHRDIVASIRAGEQQRVVDVIRAHIVVQGEKFTSLIASLEAEERAKAS